MQRIIGDKGRHDKGVGRGDMLSGVSIDQIAVLDRAHAKSIERRIASGE